MANAEENPKVSSNAGVVSGSVVCLIASVAAFWYFSMFALEVKKEVVHQDSKIRLLSDKVFLNQSRIETENALKELREHCQSPKVDLSKVASEVKKEVAHQDSKIQNSTTFGQGVYRSVQD